MSARRSADLLNLGPLELPNDYRHAYVQLVQGDSLVENGLRARASRPRQGQILDAPYLRNRGLFDRLLGIFSGKTPVPPLSLDPPFDSNGADQHGHLEKLADVPQIETHGAAIGEVRRIRGRLVALDGEIPQDRALLRDYWLTNPPAMHASEAIDLAICPPVGPPVVFSCEQAPLLIGRPTRVTMSGFLSRVGPRMRALLRAMHVRRRRDEEGQQVIMTAGQMVEALFVVHKEIQSAQDFVLDGEKRRLPADLMPNGDPYRGTLNVRVLIGGDAPGIRAVVRWIEG